MFEFIQYLLVVTSGGFFFFQRYWKENKSTELPRAIKYIFYWLIFATAATALGQFGGWNWNSF